MTPLSLGIFASANTTVNTSFESIATVTVGSGGSSTITFSSIPSTYAHLQLRWIANTNRSTYGVDDLVTRFNSDSGTNYAYHGIYGTGASAVTAADTSVTSILLFNGAGTTVSGTWWGGGVLDVLDYTNTNKYSTARALYGCDLNGNTIGGTVTGRVNLWSGLWMNTAAVSSLTITANSGSNFQQYSHFALYGIKSA